MLELLAVPRCPASCMLRPWLRTGPVGPSALGDNCIHAVNASSGFPWCSENICSMSSVYLLASRQAISSPTKACVMGVRAGVHQGTVNTFSHGWPRRATYGRQRPFPEPPCTHMRGRQSFWLGVMLPLLGLGCGLDQPMSIQDFCAPGPRCSIRLHQ